MSGNTDRGRDGCRVPLPWKTSQSGAFGFSNDESLAPDQSWLPQPLNWGRFSAQGQEVDENSMLNLYRDALRIRKTNSHLRDSFFRWIDTSDRQFMFARKDDESLLCIVTFEVGEPMPPQYEVLLSSQVIESGFIPPDTTVWLQRMI